MLFKFASVNKLITNIFCMFTAQTLKVNDGPQCTICEFAVTQLDNMLSDNATQVCGFFCSPFIFFFAKLRLFAHFYL